METIGAAKAQSERIYAKIAHQLSEISHKEVGARIRRAKLEAGLSQKGLAKRLGVSSKTVANYEHGAAKPYERLREIAEITAVTRTIDDQYEWLLHGDPEEPAPGWASELRDAIVDLTAELRHWRAERR